VPIFSNDAEKGSKFVQAGARRTFAIALINGMPIQTVGKLLGHSKLIISQIYAKVMKSKINDGIANLSLKLL
jgi:site-specific recombinase XerD